MVNSGMVGARTTDLTAAVASLIVPSFFAFGYFVLITDPGNARTLFVLARVFLLCFPLFWVIAIDKSGFPLPRMKRDGFGTGFVVGGLLTVFGLVLYFSIFDDLLQVEGIQEKAALLGFDGSAYWPYSILIVVVNSSLEEYYWRWFGFSKLKSIIPIGWALIISALGFTLHHLIVLTVYFAWPYAVAFAFCVFVGGVMFACLYLKYDSIWSPWVCHAIIDAGIMVVGYDIILC